MRLVIGDGYTLPFATSPDGPPNPATGRPVVTGLPVVTGRYRPALFEAVQEYQYRFGRAATGKEQAQAVADLVAAHVTDWDVEATAGGPAPVTADAVRGMPTPVVDQLVEFVLRWAAKEQGAAAGN